jgi:hypothetical protein
MRDWFSEQSIEAEVVIIPEAEGTSPPPRGAEVDALSRIRFVSGRAVCFLEGEIRRERRLEEQSAVVRINWNGDVLLNVETMTY